MMTFNKIRFGCIDRYNPNKGFGFLTCLFPKEKSISKTFFHITKIKYSYPEFASTLDESSFIVKKEKCYCWYELEITHKGQQARNIWLKKEDIPEIHRDELSGMNILFMNYIQKQDEVIILLQPSWWGFLIEELLDNSQKDKLRSGEDNYLVDNQKNNEMLESLRNMGDRVPLLQLEEDSIPKKETEVDRLVRKYKLSMIEAEELYNLLLEVRPLEFRKSHQLTNYITRNRLGRKYKHIAGILTMSDGVNKWKYRDGFPRKIYAIICIELALGNKNTDARVIEEQTYAERDKSRHSRS